MSPQATVDFTALDQPAKEILTRYDQKQAAMLPLLHLVQERFGLISPEAESWVGEKTGVALSHVHEVVTFYTMYRTKAIGRCHLQVCTNLPCVLRGAESVLAYLKERLGIDVGETTPDGKFTLSSVECLCACEIAPMAQVNDRYVGPLDRAAVDTLLGDTTLAPLTPSLSPGGRGREGEGILSRRLGRAAGAWYDAYVADGGYEAAKKALTTMTPAQVIDEVTRANLRGLGGAGFPTGKKWSFIPKNPSKPVYLVVNADEGEPGTFKDRYLLERDPHAVIEGMLIAAYAIGSHKAYIYIRGEYVESYRRFCRAIVEARAHGWVGKVLRHACPEPRRGTQDGTALWDWEITVHRGAGAYICGEETALLTSLEGGKGFPRLKPPFPAISGLFASPTIVNNVETLAAVPPILRRGAAWFAGLGTLKQGGTRLFSVCGHVEQPGVYEAPVSVTLRSLIEQAGGVRGRRTLKAVIPGGISAKILTASEIDVAMDFDSLMAAGTMAGSGGVIVMDDTTCMVKALWTAAKFFAHESCGQCSPCREGTGWIFKVLTRILHGQGRPQDLDVLLSAAGGMEGKTICVFADAAAWPVQSYIRKFRAEFEHHVREGHCDLLPSPVSLSPQGRG